MTTLSHRPSRRLALHRRIREALERDLRSGQLAPGARLPSELEIMLRHGVSRHVVRLALAELAKEGLIRTERGRGSFANPPKEIHPITTLTSYHRKMQEKGIEPDVRVIRNRSVALPGGLAARLNLAKGDRAVELARVAYLGGVPAMFMVSFLPMRACPGLTKQDMSQNSLYAYLESAYGLRLARAENYIEVTFASREQATHLGVAAGSVLLLIEGLVYDQNGRPVELSRIFYRGDRFRLFFESSRLGGSTSARIMLGE